MVFLKPGCLLISGFLPRFAGRWYLGCWTTCSTRLRWNDETATFGWPKLIKSVPSGTQLSQARMLLAWPLMGTNRLDTGELFILSILWPCYRMILHVLLNKILRFDASEYESHYSHTWLSGSFNLCIVWLCVCMLFHCSIVPLLYYIGLHHRDWMVVLSSLRSPASSLAQKNGPESNRGSCWWFNYGLW
jgi:hypothetical protein